MGSLLQSWRSERAGGGSTTRTFLRKRGRSSESENSPLQPCILATPQPKRPPRPTPPKRAPKSAPRAVIERAGVSQSLRNYFKEVDAYPLDLEPHAPSRTVPHPTVTTPALRDVRGAAGVQASRARTSRQLTIEKLALPNKAGVSSPTSVHSAPLLPSTQHLHLTSASPLLPSSRHLAFQTSPAILPSTQRQVASTPANLLATSQESFFNQSAPLPPPIHDPSLHLSSLLLSSTDHSSSVAPAPLLPSTSTLALVSVAPSMPSVPSQFLSATTSLLPSTQSQPLTSDATPLPIHKSSPVTYTSPLYELDNSSSLKPAARDSPCPTEEVSSPAPSEVCECNGRPLNGSEGAAADVLTIHKELSDEEREILEQQGDAFPAPEPAAPISQPPSVSSLERLLLSVRREEAQQQAQLSQLPPGHQIEQCTTWADPRLVDLMACFTAEDARIGAARMAGRVEWPNRVHLLVASAAHGGGAAGYIWSQLGATAEGSVDEPNLPRIHHMYVRDRCRRAQFGRRLLHWWRSHYALHVEAFAVTKPNKQMTDLLQRNGCSHVLQRSGFEGSAQHFHALPAGAHASRSSQ